jgi:hypothetical protein
LPDARRSWQRSLHILDELHHPRANQIRNKLRSVEAVLLTSLSARALPDPAGYGA